MSIDMDRVIELPDPMVYWVAELDSPKSISAISTDLETVENQARDMAIAKDRPLRVMRDAGLLSTVNVFDRDGSPISLTTWRDYINV